MATNSTSDAAAIKSLQDKLKADQLVVTGDGTANNPGLQSAYNNLLTQYNTVNANYLHAQQVYNDVINFNGQWANYRDAMNKFNTYQANPTAQNQLSATAVAVSNDYIKAAQNSFADLNGIEKTLYLIQSADGKSGSLVAAKTALDSANSQIQSDITNITSFVPTTPEGAQAHQAALNSAATITSNLAQSKAATAAATIAGVNFASINTKYLIIGGVILAVIIGGIFVYLKMKKRV